MRFNEWGTSCGSDFSSLDLLVLPCLSYIFFFFCFSPMKPCYVRCVPDKWNCGILVSWLLRFRGLFLLFVKFTSLYAPSILSVLQVATSKHTETYAHKHLLLFVYFVKKKKICFFHPMRICTPVTTEYHIRQSDHVRITTSE